MCAAASHICASPPFFFRVLGSSRSPPGGSGVRDINANDSTLCRYRTVSRHAKPIGTHAVVVTTDDGQGSDCSISDYIKTGIISVTYGLDDEKIGAHVGGGCLPDIVGFSHDIDSVRESLGAAKIRSVALGRSSETEPHGSPFAEQSGHGVGNQWYVKTEDEKGSITSRCRTRSNIVNSKMDWHGPSDGSSLEPNLQPGGSRPQDDQCEGASFRLQFNPRVDLDC